MDSDIGRSKRAVPQIKPVLIEGGEYFTAERKYTEPRGPIQCCTRKKPAIPRVCPFCGDNRYKAEPKETTRSVKRAACEDIETSEMVFLQGIKAERKQG